MIQVCPPQCGNILISTEKFSDAGFTEAGVFITEIYNNRIDSLVSLDLLDGSYLARFQLNQLQIIFDNNQFALKTTDVQCVTTPCPPLTEPLVIYELAYTLSGFNQIVIDEQTIPMNATEAPVEQVVEEDTPTTPCPDVKDDSISFLFPTDEVSGTRNLWDKTVEGFDIINVDIRNNRNCDLTLAVGSQWQRVTGQIFKSDIEEILMATNSTIPFRSIPFDSAMDCGGSTCAGLEIQWCFIAKATVGDVTEIVDPFCGKKFYR